MFKIGDNIQVKGKVVLAPMAGVTFYAYRKFMASFGVSLFYSEMVSDCGLIYENKETLGDKKSVTLRFNLSSFDHTLSGEEIEKFRSDILEFLSRNKLELRG